MIQHEKSNKNNNNNNQINNNFNKSRNNNINEVTMTPHIKIGLVQLRQSIFYYYGDVRHILDMYQSDF